MKAKDFIKFMQDLEKIEQEGYLIDYRLEMENTGITELEPAPLAMWKEFVDLGGRSITIHITIPNRKTLEEAIKSRK